MDDLFDLTGNKNTSPMSNVPHVESKNVDLMARPLAVRMRPTVLDDVVGQDEALSNTSPLRAVATPPNMMSGSAASSIILNDDFRLGS